MDKLKIANDLSLPLNAVTQTLAQIGRRGAGKTYLATVIAEQMLDCGAQVIILDPIGNWYGLRIAADGKSRGKNIFVIGGEHGDIPLPPEGGARIGRLLATKRVSSIIDISQFRQGERKRFAADFAEEFFHVKKNQRSAVHIFIEEAQLFVPQMCRPNEARMLGAFENIVRLGRNYGIGASLISQRPQSVNKEVLSQVECLCVLQVTGTHERKALDAWVQEAGADRNLIGKLPGLARGEGFVWSPAWLRTFQRVQFARKTTFDASATPEVGQQASAAMLSAMDVNALKRDLDELGAQTEEDSTEDLKRKIADLEGQVAAASGVTAQAVEEMRHELDSARAETTQWETRYAALRDLLIAERRRINQALAGQPDSKSTTVTPEAPPPLLFDAVMSTPAAVASADGKSEQLSKPYRTVLMTLAQYGESSKAKIAILAGYAANGTSLSSALGDLRAKNWIRGLDPFTITSAGLSALGPVNPLPSGADLLAMWNQKLDRAGRTILATLTHHGELSKQQLADHTGYVPTGTAFGAAIDNLKMLDLIEGATDLRLFPRFAEALRL